MKFSIIVPVYKVEKYIDKCIYSLINQTYSDIEIILVDDGSPDNCPKICDYYALIDSRIKVIHKQNGGLSDARNKGIANAMGDYLIFVDSDDYVELDMCERLVHYTESNPQIISINAYVEGGKNFIEHYSKEECLNGQEFLIKSFESNSCSMAACLYVYKKSFIIQNDLYFKFGILHEDEQFTPRALLKAEKICSTNLKYYHYVIREGSITTKKDKRKNAQDIYDTICELEKIYLMLPSEKLKDYLLNYLVNLYLSTFAACRLYKYGKEYIHKEFVKRNAITKRTKLKARLFCFNTKLYYFVNWLSKKIRGGKCPGRDF